VHLSPPGTWRPSTEELRDEDAKAGAVHADYVRGRAGVVPPDEGDPGPVG
jgi:hypothetical protein